MANLKDLIVNGAARIIGKTYSSEFVGDVTGDVTGNVSGNASSATKLETERSLKITDGTNTSSGVSFNGTSDVTLSLPTTIKATFSGDLTGNVTGNATTATKAAQDSAGQQINTTYIRGLSVDGRTITYTKGDDTTDTITTQDTTYSTATATSAGLMSADDKSTLDNIAGSGTPFVRKRDNGCSYNNLASFYAEGHVYKYLRITIPPESSTYTMCTLEITLKQNYNAGYFGKILFHGKWSTSDEWNTLFSYVYGRLSRDVKLYTSDKKYIYITGSDAWATCSVDKMLIGDNATNYDLSAVIIDGVDSLPDTYQTVTVTYGVDSSNIGDQSVLKASQDSDGNSIKDTYLKLSGGTLTGNTTFNKYLKINAWEGYGTGSADFWYNANDKYVEIQNATNLKLSGKNVWKSGDLITGAVFNDLADAIPVGEGDVLEAGYCYGFDGEHYTKTSEYMQKSYIGIHSDTYGFKMGHEEGKEKLNVAVSGFVLAYVDREYEVGTPLTCTADGYLTEIKFEDKIKYPERIVATYWKNESNEEWGPEDKKVRVNGRRWVKIK